MVHATLTATVVRIADVSNARGTVLYSKRMGR